MSSTKTLLIDETPLSEDKITIQIHQSQTYSTTIRVIYANTDKMGVVYHAKYLEFFEIARNELLREVGFSYKKLEENGIFLPIIETQLKYYRPALYDDLLTVKTFITQEAHKPLRYKIFCKVYCNDLLLTEGYTTHVTSNEQGRPCKPDKAIANELNTKLFGK